MRNPIRNQNSITNRPSGNGEATTNPTAVTTTKTTITITTTTTTALQLASTYLRYKINTMTTAGMRRNSKTTGTTIGMIFVPFEPSDASFFPISAG